MTEQERRILSPLARSLRAECAESWSDLKYQTQFGPEFVHFPYYPAAVEFQDPAQQAIAALDSKDKSSLLESWRSRPRYPFDFNRDERILTQYAVILVDLIVKRARQAGSRTQEW
jgi:hypothetical protein